MKDIIHTYTCDWCGRNAITSDTHKQNMIKSGGKNDPLTNWFSVENLKTVTVKNTLYQRIFYG